MKTFDEKEKKLSLALEKLKSLDIVNPKLKEHTKYLDNQKTYANRGCESFIFK